MNKVFAKGVSILAAIMLLAGVMSGCGSGSASGKNEPAETTAAQTSTTETLKKVELQFYMLGDAPKDLQEVSDKVNELAQKDLNCTVKFNFTTWTDWDQKYNLLLTSGQPVDLLFTADWTKYQQFARKGAFLPLDELVPKYAPELYQFVPQDYWNAVKIGGRIFTMPATWKEYVSNGVMYREDLRKKYDLPALDSLENIEKYMTAVKKNLPNQEISLVQNFNLNMGNGTSVTDVLNIKYKWATESTPYGLAIEYDNPKQLKQYWGSADFIEDCKMFKRWADAGFWSRSTLSNQDNPENSFNEGKYVINFNGQNAVRYADAMAKTSKSHLDFEIGWYAYGKTSGVISPVHPIHNGFAVPKSAQNPERAVMFYEKMVTDKAYNYLTEYGIEGKHYNIVDGYYTQPEGDAAKGFTREGMNGWAWRNPQIQLFDKSFDPVKKIFDEFDKVQKPDIFTGFAEDYTPYQSERAALDKVITQYLAPLQAGLVPNVEDGVKIFLEKAKTAGLDKMQAEYTKQWLQYCDESGIK